ncbi:MAG: thiamine diphosphokinase [Chloroflexi bacterium RBG_16_54_18]|nr:MAG: thiamine diphosphokinase [Chloroflexi bacterium RBG_16_54_18]
MRAVIIANGWLNQAIVLSPEDLLIAADGGARHCLEKGLHPAYVVGDMDSLDSDQVACLESQGAQFVRYPSRKDQTDLELAVDLAQYLGYSEILILGALGARWDQTIANILLPAARPNLRITLVDGDQEIHLLRTGEQIRLPGKPGDIVSLIPLAGTAAGIRTRNLEYSLEGEDLLIGSTRGVSNVMTAAPVIVELVEGLLLCIVHHL